MYAVAILMGLTGGFHCLGMCGPLVVSATGHTALRHARFIYAGGRIFTYGLLGALAGGIGELVQLTQYQNILSLSLGGLLILVGLGTIKSINIPIMSKAIYRLVSLLKTAFGKLLNKKGPITILILGALNGLLPCGLIYLAMAYCLTLSHVWEGVLFMLIFGLGTLPVMVGALWVFNRVWNHLKIDYCKINMILLIVSGILMIGRALFVHAHDMEPLNGYFGGGETLCW